MKDQKQAVQIWCACNERNTLLLRRTTKTILIYKKSRTGDVSTDFRGSNIFLQCHNAAVSAFYSNAPGWKNSASSTVHRANSKDQGSSSSNSRNAQLYFQLLQSTLGEFYLELLAALCDRPLWVTECAVRRLNPRITFSFFQCAP